MKFFQVDFHFSTFEKKTDQIPILIYSNKITIKMGDSLNIYI